MRMRSLDVGAAANERSMTMDLDEDDAGPSDSSGEINLAGLEMMTGYALRRAQMSLFRDLKSRFRPYDISSAQFSVLHVVAHNPGLAQARIAEALSIERARLVLMLDRLEERALLVRTRSKSDRRSHALHLTDDGRKLLDTLLALQAEHERTIEAVLTADGKAELLRLLAPLRA
jgi:DNA-binding MarR family transcriptional regulator